MGRYTKETALYDPGAIREDMQEAGSKAEKYITDYTDQGTFVHAEGTVDSPSATTANGVLISGTAVKIIRAGKVVAEYGTAAMIGALLENNVLINTDGTHIRHGETRVASFAENLIELGKNSASAIIKMIKGILVMSVEKISYPVEDRRTAGSIVVQDTYNSEDPSTERVYLDLAAVHTSGSSTKRAVIEMIADALNGTSHGYAQADYLSADAKELALQLGAISLAIGSGSNWTQIELSAATDLLHYSHYDADNASDANDFTRNGFVRLPNSHGCLNLPLTNACYVLTLGSNENNKIQFCTAANISTFVLYMRKCSGGEWGSWKSITFS